DRALVADAERLAVVDAADQRAGRLAAKRRVGGRAAGVRTTGSGDVVVVVAQANLAGRPEHQPLSLDDANARVHPAGIAGHPDRAPAAVVVGLVVLVVPSSGARPLGTRQIDARHVARAELTGDPVGVEGDPA